MDLEICRIIGLMTKVILYKGEGIPLWYSFFWVAPICHQNPIGTESSFNQDHEIPDPCPVFTEPEQLKYSIIYTISARYSFAAGFPAGCSKIKSIKRLVYISRPSFINSSLRPPIPIGCRPTESP